MLTTTCIPSTSAILPRLASQYTPAVTRMAACSPAVKVTRHRGSRRTYATATPSPPASSSSPPTPLSTSPAAKATETQERERLFEDLKNSYVMDHHTTYKEQDLDSVDVLNHKPQNFSDRVAHSLVKMMRSTFDFATRYPGTKKFPMVAGREKDLVRLRDRDSKGNDLLPETMPLEEMRAKGLSFSPEQWLNRCIFLESVAGCPGSVAAVARHLHSLRLLRRDKGWIHTCLEDAENERMHLLSFLAITKPGRIMRLLLLGAQGVFFNALFALYLLHPRTVHRFVGVLEEEAVKTYTGLIKDVQEGRLPEWENMDAPEIAKEYWKLPATAKMLDMIKVIRADEAGHRFIHHTLADLDQKEDTNPFSVATPTARTIGTKLHLTREESLQFIADAKRVAEEEVRNAQEQQHKQREQRGPAA